VRNVRKRYPLMRNYSDKEIVQALYRSGNAIIKDVPFDSWQWDDKETKFKQELQVEANDIAYGGFLSQFQGATEQFAYATPQTFGAAGVATGQFLSDIGMESIGEGIKNLARPAEEWGSEILQQHIDNDTDLQGKLNWASQNKIENWSDVFNPGILGRITSSTATSLTAMFLPMGSVKGAAGLLKLSQQLATNLGRISATTSMFVLESGDQYQTAKQTYEENPQLIENLRNEIAPALIEKYSKNNPDLTKTQLESLVNDETNRLVETLSARSAYMYGAVAAPLETVVPWATGWLGRPISKTFGKSVYGKIANKVVNGMDIDKAFVQATEETTKLYTSTFRALDWGKPGWKTLLATGGESCDRRCTVYFLNS
jgi:hypothetical protein